MDTQDAPESRGGPIPTPHSGSTAAVGRVVGIVGLVAFVLLGLVVVIGMFLPDAQARAAAVGCFPWSLGALAVGFVGMGVAASARPRGQEDEDDEDPVVPQGRS
ncbi:MAG: hypothetical protein L0H81_08050 [Actinomyces sp.]|nr:hypothetical protein [Actinomyces sp.]MDN6429921.1 hypothetical protein [Propionibacterium sp.]MDN6795615.1 hypothetical protein [Propionibacterium sp.]